MHVMLIEEKERASWYCVGKRRDERCSIDRNGVLFASRMDFGDNFRKERILALPGRKGV